jgi:hypothetical protein
MSTRRITTVTVAAIVAALVAVALNLLPMTFGGRFRLQRSPVCADMITPGGVMNLQDALKVGISK